MKEEIIDYWFSERVREKWWSKDAAFDDEIRERFSGLFQRATAGELAHWRTTPQGRLAEIIVLDQFPRNMFRDQPESFAHDPFARERTHAALAAGADQELTSRQRAFLYMPLMHSEDPADHQLAVKLYASDPELAGNYRFELHHKAIIDRFGRYPHRNAILGRDSTPEEEAFLKGPGSSF